MIVLTAPHVTMLLPEGAGEELVGRLRRAVLEPDPLAAVVDALISSGLLGLPSFCGAFTAGDGCHLLARGDGVAAATARDGTVSRVVSRPGVTTWSEELFDDLTSVTLGSREGSGPVVEVLVLRPAVVAKAPAVAVDAPSTTATGSEPGDVSRATVPLPAVHGAGPQPAHDEAGREVASPEDPQPGGGAVDPPLSEHTLAAPHDLDLPVPPEGAKRSESGAEEDRRAGDEPDFDFSHMLEETHYRGAEAAAIRATEPADEERVSAPAMDAVAPVPAVVRLPPATLGGLIDGIPGLAASGGRRPAPVADGDHDGHTIAARNLRSIIASPSPSTPLPGSPGVQAVFCCAGHPNPPHADRCRSCRGEISDRTVRSIARPSVGRLRFLSGAMVELDRSQLIGRRPAVGAAQPITEMPGFVTVPDPEQALSRVHAEVRLDGWEVFVVDRGSKNGTFVEIPGHPPTKLRAGEPCLIVVGTRVTLADVCTFVFEGGGHDQRSP